MELFTMEAVMVPHAPEFLYRNQRLAGQLLFAAYSRL